MIQQLLTRYQFDPSGPGPPILGGIVLGVGLLSLGLVVMDRNSDWSERFKPLRASVLFIVGGTGILLWSPWLRSHVDLHFASGWADWIMAQNEKSALVVIPTLALVALLAWWWRRR